MANLERAWRELEQSTDGWDWYWLSYGEKCYAFATVTAFPLNEDECAPPAGTMLSQHPEDPQVWVGENGTEMLIDQWIANIEQQNGDVICSFIAQAFADAKEKFSKKL